MSAMNKEKDTIELLKNELESKYNIGDRTTWTHQDFENLSAFIQKKSSISVSVSTLKRLYGKIATNSTPRHSSLDAICIYLGYKNWYDYQQKKKSAAPIKKDKARKNNKGKFSTALYLIIAISLLTGSYFIIDIFDNPVKQNMNRKFIFETADTFGIVPYPIRLKVDIRNLKGGEFQITHPEKDEAIVLKDKDSVLHFFFRKAGIHELSLLQEGKKLKTIKIYTVYDEWTAEVYFNNKPTLHFTKNQLLDDTTLTIPMEQFMTNVKLDGFRIIKYLSGYDDVFPLDYFRIKTRYRYVPIDGYDACLKSYLTIAGKEGHLSFPLAHRSCLKTLHVFIDNNNKHYQVINDPELFSYNNPEWVNMLIIKNHRKVKVYRDNKLIINEECKSTWGDFLFVKYLFVGNGEIDYLRIFDRHHSLIYGEEFNGGEAD